MLRKTPSNIREIMRKYLSTSVFDLNDMERHLPLHASIPPQPTHRYQYKRQLSSVRRNLEDEIEEVLKYSSTRLYPKAVPVKSYRNSQTTRASVPRPLPAYTPRTPKKPVVSYVPKKPYLDPLILPRRPVAVASPVKQIIPAKVKPVPASNFKRSVSLLDLSPTKPKPPIVVVNNHSIHPIYKYDSLYKLTSDYGWDVERDNSKYDTYNYISTPRPQFDSAYESMDMSGRSDYHNRKHLSNTGTKISTAAAKAYYRSAVGSTGLTYRPTMNGSFNSTFSTPSRGFRSIEYHSTPVSLDDSKPKSRQKLDMDKAESDVQVNGDKNGDFSDDEEMDEEDAKEMQDAEALVEKLMEENKAQLEAESEEERESGKTKDNSSPKKFDTIAEPHRWLGCGFHADPVSLTADRGYLLWTNPQGELQIVFAYGETGQEFSLFIDPQFPGVKLYHMRPTGMKELILNGKEHPRKSSNPHHKDRSPSRQDVENNFEFASYDGKVMVMLEALKNTKTPYKAFKINYTMTL